MRAMGAMIFGNTLETPFFLVQTALLALLIFVHIDEAAQNLRFFAPWGQREGEKIQTFVLRCRWLAVKAEWEIERRATYETGFI